MKVNIISSVIFLLGNLLLIFQDNLNFSKNYILLINIVAIIGLYIIYFVIYLNLA